MGFKMSSAKLVAELDDYITNIIGSFGVTLFVNNYTPDETSTAGNFTAPTFAGYAPITGQTFGSSAMVGSVAEASSPQVQFTVSATGGTDLVYGYVILQGGTTYVGAERFAGGPVPMDTIGQILAVTPRLTHGNA